LEQLSEGSVEGLNNRNPLNRPDNWDGIACDLVHVQANRRARG
jgi:hypothetical protein